jgi:hypothetical protein
MRNTGRWVILALSLAAAALVTIGIIAAGTDHDSRDGKATLSEVESYLGVAVPNDAADITVNAVLERNEAAVDLRFTASLAGALSFGETLCGELHQGYDPFQAINNDSSSPDAHLIKAETFTYYSYSPNTSASVHGNRCLSPHGATYNIRIEASSPDQAGVRLNMPGGDCHSATPPAVCTSPAPNYIRPVANYPLIVIGLEAENNALVLAHDEICLDFVGDYEFSWQESWSYLEGSTVIVTVDGEPFPPGMISHQRLVPQASPERMWAYCAARNWAQGEHTIAVQIVTPAGNEEAYSVVYEAG